MRPIRTNPVLCRREHYCMHPCTAKRLIISQGFGNMDRLQHLLRNVDGIFPALGLPDRCGIAVMEDGTPRTNYFRCDFWLMHISSVLPMSEFPAGITFMNYCQIHRQFPICTTPLLHRRCGFLLHVSFGLVPRLQDWFAA